MKNTEFCREKKETIQHISKNSVSTVKPAYNDTALHDTLSVASDIL